MYKGISLFVTLLRKVKLFECKVFEYSIKFCFSAPSPINKKCKSGFDILDILYKINSNA